VGNHELSEKGIAAEEAAAEIQAQLQRLGKPNNYYKAAHGPVDFFMIDSSSPQATGQGGAEQIAWLKQALAESTATWKVAALHHPPYTSGVRGSNMVVRDALEPIFVEGGVDIVFTGHDHHYERTHPQRGIVYVVSGAGCKLSRVRPSEFTALATSELQFMLVEADRTSMEVRCIGVEGQTIDAFVLSPRNQT
jgi:3',5'-cyclic AMP phosphodiesterase CpdA